MLFLTPPPSYQSTSLFWKNHKADNCISYYDSSSIYNGRCRTCNSGYYTNPSAGVLDCHSCFTNCGTCFNTATCEKCKIGYYKKSDTECASCVPGCSQCENPNHCEICKNGYYHTPSLLCAKCPSNCDKCSEKDVCLECVPGYYLDSGGKCSTCGANCDECHSRFHCERCHKDYEVGVDGECTRKRLLSLLYLGFFIIGALLTCALCYYFCSRSREPTARGYNGPNGYELWDGGSQLNRPVGGWSGSTVYDHPGAQQHKGFFDKQYNDGYGQFNYATGGYDKAGAYASNHQGGGPEF